jgi:catechol 2,3-dioxygenase-like lactoylglutathione lyase family enzyme
MIEGLSHITFIVSELERTSHLLTRIFDAREVYSSGEKTYSVSKEKFFLINGLWIAIMEGDSLTEKTYNHVALKVSEADFEKYSERVRSLNLEILKGRSRVAGEGKSLYFYDYDNHLFELHTGTLDQRIKSYKEVSTVQHPTGTDHGGCALPTFE